MSSAFNHRIDPPEPVLPRVARRRSAHAVAGTDPARLPPELDGETANDDRFPADHPSDDSTGRSDWLGLHAEELIDRLQTWSADLDARESQLNLRASMQDQHERQFRLRQQDLAADLAQQQRAVERLRGEIQAQARRLAFE